MEKKILFPILFGILFFCCSCPALAECIGSECGASASTNNDVQQGQSQFDGSVHAQSNNQQLIYAPSSNVENTSFPVTPSAGMLSPAGGYHLPNKNPPANAISAKAFSYFKNSYSDSELKSMLVGKNFEMVGMEIISQLPATNRIAVYVQKDLPPGKYTKLATLNVVGEGDNESTISAGAMAALWSTTVGANVILVPRAGYNRYFQSRSFGAGSSAVGAAIEVSQKIAGGLAGLLGFTNLKSEHKGRAWVNAIALHWEPLTEENNE